jgi:predicted AlkP superfamily pyrophosphatase or phosphodiesterase
MSKIILVVFDGCRPDGLAQAHTPNVDDLWRSGAYSWTAQSVTPSVTLPTHLSMFRSVSPEKHGVTDNIYHPPAADYPSVMDIAHKAGLKTAMFYSWEELRDLSAPGSVDVSYYHHAYGVDATDHNVAEWARLFIVAEQPELSLVYFGESDLAGHESGWMSAPYIAAIEDMDRALGRVMWALKQVRLYDKFTWLFLADHGGHDHAHGTDAPEDLTIPWILSGPGAKKGYEIHSPVRIMDTAATISHLLDLPRPPIWEGAPVWDALDDSG